MTVLKIPQHIVDDIFAHGREEAPLEACGYLGGQGDSISRHWRMYNVDQSPEHFTLDPKEQFSVIKLARADNLKITAVYHTHPASPARPSEEDIRLAYDPTILYVIASLHEGQTIKCFRIVNGLVTPVEISVI